MLGAEGYAPVSNSILTDRQTDRQTNGQTNTQTDTQTDNIPVHAY
jgi:hypothetical protein